MLNKKKWIVCSKYGNYFRFNNDIIGRIYDHLMSTKIFTLEYDIHMSPKHYEGGGYDLNLESLTISW